MTDNTSRLSTALADRYQIERRLGEGGMATVYLAEDLKHQRKVALKVLRPELAAVLGAERFVQEITTTANLQHPHILPLFDSGEADSFLYYVMPFIDGETLRDKLDRESQLGIDEAVRIAREIGDALDYAHRHGIIHRDIKPENILLHDGRPMVADFGIALALSAAAGGRMTETGLSLGTPHYMSPEQATAEKDLTNRADIYSLGSVLYEMLVGDPPHVGSTAQQIIMKIVTDEARPITELRKSVPPHVAAAVAKALEKLPADRFETAAQMVEALGNAAFSGPVTGARSGVQGDRGGDKRAWGVSAILGIVLLVTWGSMWLGGGGVDAPVLRASILPPEECGYTSVSASNLIQLSPLGRNLAYIASCDGELSLRVRSLETGEDRSFPGTEGAIYPFWSFDGRSLGFFADGRLKRIDLESNAVRDLGAAPFGRGGAWNQHGQILFAPDLFGPLFVIPADGGEPVQEGEAGEGVSNRIPYFMPDGRHYIYSATTSGTGGRLIFGELGSAEARELLDVGSNVALSAGHLLYVRDGALVARRFSSRSGEFDSPGTSLLSGLETWEAKSLGNFAVSGDGSLLVYRESTVRNGRMAWFDPRTAIVEQIETAGARSVALAPNGRSILLVRYTGPGQRFDVWLHDVDSGQETRLSTASASSWVMGWANEGAQAAFQDASRSDAGATFVAADRSGERTVRFPPGVWVPTAWPRGQSYGISTWQVSSTGFDLLRATIAGDSASAEVLYATPADETDPSVSADGEWLAYGSSGTGSGSTGSGDIYITRLPDATGHWKVSRAAGFRPRWSRSGGRLYFLGVGGELLVSDVVTAPEVRPGAPRAVSGAPAGIVSFDTAPDGRLLIVYDVRGDDTPLTVIENWTQLLEGR